MEVSIIRIHILGGSGSGKSYIAKQLSVKHNIPHFDLDDIFWDNTANTYGVKASEEDRDKRLKEIVIRESWIVEGVYIGWLEPSFYVADKIFVLTPPLALQEERIWRRYEERKSGNIPSGKKETYESVQALVKWNETYNQNSLPHFIHNSEYSGKIIKVDDNSGIIHHLTFINSI